ncbi:hypothetical protein [Kitasatospora sp. NPDC050543]|uniref:deoxynucleotide monophosphate kinase family protein n=1 Tax=Kitasatospora sp. NPDC050543 TaxID=3364054 RepID=UPI00378ED64D
MNIGIIGRARSGKDTAGGWLVEQRGYQRVALADPLKDAAWRVDPITHAGFFAEQRRLSDIIAGPGDWERAKETTPEVRRFLQELGAAIRSIDRDFWLRAALTTADAANEAGRNVCITDVRYPNEADALRDRGWHLLYVDRPGIPHLDHESEGALAAEDADYTIVNAGSVAVYLAAVELFHSRVLDAESARHYGRAHA